MLLPSSRDPLAISVNLEGLEGLLDKIGFRASWTPILLQRAKRARAEFSKGRNVTAKPEALTKSYRYVGHPGAKKAIRVGAQ